jgi:hypothetical protein
MRGSRMIRIMERLERHGFIEISIKSLYQQTPSCYREALWQR